MVSPFRGDGPFRGRGPFLGRGPWAGRGPGGFNVGIPFAIDATGEHIRAAISDPTAYASGGYLLRGLGGARLNAAARASVAMQQKSDGTYEYAAHNLLLNSATMATQTVTVVSGAAYTLSAFGTGSIATSGAAVATLTGTGADNRVTVTVTATTTSLVMTLTGAMDRAQLNLGPTALPYVPTTSAAVYAPAVDWLSAQSAYGLRSEAAATNLVLYSADMGNAAYLAFSVGTSKGAAVLAPDGTTTATPITFGASASAQVYQSLSEASAQRTLSIFARSASGKKFRLKIYTGISDVVTTDFVPSSSWQRFSLTTTNAVSDIAVLNESGGGAGTVEFWCPQLETGSRASSPILTLGATATRAADTLIEPVATSVAGTMVIDYVPSQAGSQVIAQLDDTTANERHRVMNDGIYDVVDGGVTQASVDGGTPVVGALNRVAVTWQANRFAISLNGGAAIEDFSGTVPTTTRLLLADVANAFIVRQRLISGRAVNISQLQALSA